jgi:hypothetical protein
VYPAGRFVATVTATGVTGEIAQAQVEIAVREQTLSLRTPGAADYGKEVTLTGALRPARRAQVRIYRARTYVTTVTAKAGGGFRARILLRAPGPYEARFGGVRSRARAIRVRPRLETSLPPTAVLGAPLVFSARLVPSEAGKIRVVVRREGRLIAGRVGRTLRLRLPTGRASKLEVVVGTRTRKGYSGVTRRLVARVVLPSLSLGARGPSVFALERRLSELRYALRTVDSLYSTDTLEAVLAFQKVHRLARTGRVDAALWRRLGRATVPKPRFGLSGDRIEIDKTRQVLFAIHGYPSVPAYPASHGCVRVPMWIAPSLFARHDYGATIVVYA